MSILEVNQRYNPFFQRIIGIKEIIKSEKVERCIHALLPLLILCRPIKTAVTLQLGCVNVIKSLQDLSINYNQRAYRKGTVNFVELVGTITLVALSIFKPVFASVGGELTKMAEETASLGSSLYVREGRQAALKALSVTHSMIYMASILTAAPELIAISLIAQGALELYQSYGEFQKERWIESAAKLSLSTIRFIQAKPFLEQSYRNIRLTYEKYRIDKLLKEAIYNNQFDSKFIVLLKGMKHRLFTFFLTQYFFDPWSDLDGANFKTPYGDVLEVQSENGKGFLYYLSFTYEKFGKYPKIQTAMNFQFLNEISQETGIIFDVDSQTCVHPTLNKGYWKLNWGSYSFKGKVFNYDQYTLSLSISFDEGNSNNWFQTASDLQIAKKSTISGRDIPLLRWIMERLKF